MKNRFERQIAFFGEKGQATLNKIKVIIVGVGGIGSHVAQQLAFLGIGSITIIDDDTLEETNMNRLIGVRSDDTFGTLKVDIAKRNILSINSEITVNALPYSIIHNESFAEIKTGDFVFICVDNDGAKLVLNELCLAYEKPFIDAASDILKDASEYGGHVIAVTDNSCCLHCLDQIDPYEARRFLENPDARKDENAIYGVDKSLLNKGGPSVVSINGVIASLAVTEFLLDATGLRKMNKFLKYRGSKGIVLKDINISKSDCYWCNSIRAKYDKAGIENYLKRIQ